MTIPQIHIAPAFSDLLLGMVLVGDSGQHWTVIQQLPRTRPGATGGTFSSGYIVSDGSGRRSFMKALDLSSALRSPNPTMHLQAMTTAFNFERDLLDLCRSKRVDRVVLAEDYGQITIDPQNVGSIVPFIVFELGRGDIRTFVEFSQQFDEPWVLRTLHEVALGLVQLHRNNIAHQDVKPSNVLMFDARDGAKVCDMGRASQKGALSPHEPLPIAGDRTYAPPELLYGNIAVDWGARRFGCDAYLLGSLVVSFLTGASLTSLIHGHLAVSHRWQNWGDSYANVLPYVRQAFNKAMSDIEAQVKPSLWASTGRIVRELCDPDPSVRGHPRARAQKNGNPYALDRYVSEFDLLARRAENGIVRKSPRTIAQAPALTPPMAGNP